MQVTIEVEKELLEKVANDALKKLLEYNKYTYGEGARLIVEKTKETLSAIIMDYDFEETIKGIFEDAILNIARDVVTEEIRKIARKTVKDMRARGDLLNESNP